MTRSDQVKDWAREIGFDKVGIAESGFATNGEQLAEWFLRGYHAGMGWMLNNAYRRLDPRCVLPGANSIISLAINYFTEDERRPDELKVSRYAWGNDYHRLMGKMLKKLATRIGNEWPGSANLWYVDTGPILEKAWAQQAGLGWVGKNNVLISRDFGPWLLLGEVITTLKLDPDEPETDHCGTCTRCLDSCPANALVEPYVVDAGRCISYWTIEHRGDFPEEVACMLDGWAFGCDICLEVCPFDRFHRATKLPDEFSPRRELLHPDRWLEIGEEEFMELTARSPLRRARLHGMRRNVRAATAARNIRRRIAGAQARR